MEPRARLHFAVRALFLAALAFGPLVRAGAPEGARTHTVVIEEMKFSPAELRIHPGERVVFQNKDLVPHTATAADSKAFDSGLIDAGASWSTQVDGTPQTIRYVCLYHPTMTGRIVVERP